MKMRGFHLQPIQGIGPEELGLFLGGPRHRFDQADLLPTILRKPFAVWKRIICPLGDLVFALDLDVMVEHGGVVEN